MLYTLILSIAKKEMTIAFRLKSYRVMAMILFILFLASAAGGLNLYQTHSRERAAAEQEKRRQWLNQDRKHPHIAAHFGNFAFMPKTALSLFDYGLDSYTGAVLYLEPHRQNEFSFKPAESQDSAFRFGELSMALILQLLFPLLIIFQCYGSFTREREEGTLDLLYAQGISFPELFLGKLAGNGVLVLLLGFPAILFLGVGGVVLSPSGAVLIRIVLLSILYALYLLLFVGLSLLVSAWCRDSRSSLLSLLGAWICLTILLPKWAANAGDNLHPLPSKYEFSVAVRKDIDSGINGHDPGSRRAQVLEAALLEKYKVDSVSQLPFNFDGYIMQAGEEYSSRVYDKHFSRLQETLKSQNQLNLTCSLIDPFMAIHQLSMGLAGTDYYTHLDFQRQAETYRRQFVQQMNGDMLQHSRLGDWNYTVGKELYARVAPFTYRAPSTRMSLTPYYGGFCSLLLWIGIIAGMVAFHDRLHLQTSKP